MTLIERITLSATLPPTPCTEDMRARIVGIAKRAGVPIAHVQRTAFEVFLSEFDSKAVKDTENLSKESEEQS